MENSLYVPSAGEYEATSYMPLRLAETVKRITANAQGTLSEIRLRSGADMMITVDGEDISCGVTVTETELQSTVRALCGNSLYSHSETIKDGYICTPGGLRAGICGKAVIENGRIVSVTDIASVALRIPHRVPGAGDAAYNALSRTGFSKGVLVFSPPGAGKTTVLRELILRLCEGQKPVRTAVVDSRFELAAGMSGLCADVLYGYPRAKGMEIAVRVLSPRVIVCDEISTDEDMRAVLSCAGGGAAMAASVHGGSVGEVLAKPIIKTLCGAGVFATLIEVIEAAGGIRRYKAHTACQQAAGTHAGRI